MNLPLQNHICTKETISRLKFADIQVLKCFLKFANINGVSGSGSTLFLVSMGQIQVMLKGHITYD